jgi:hypothetical protein
MNKEELFEILLRWNLWGNLNLDFYPREILNKIGSFLDFHGVKIIQGPRRAGKSSLLYLIMNNLLKDIPDKRFLYINFEDYALSSTELNPTTLDKFINIYGERVYSGNDYFLFLDEIQNVKNWHNWVRTFIDTHNRGDIFISGSSSKLLNSEMAPLLTGRHINFEVLPFSFREFIKVRGLKTDGINLSKNKNILKSNLNEYIKYGGFPEVALVRSVNEYRANQILSQYANDILFKDISLRYGILNMRILKYISLYLSQNNGCATSIRGLQNSIESEFGNKSSTTTISNYLEYLMESYMIFEVKHFDYSIKKMIRKPVKYYFVDTGLRNAMWTSFTQDKGRLLENIVFLKLRSLYDEIYYWKGKKEIDFVCIKGRNLDLYNVSDVSDKKEIAKRELESFSDFPDGKTINKRYLITWDYEGKIEHNGLTIEALPAYKFLLSD